MTRSRSSCSRNSILNSKTGKCKVCHSFSLIELQGIARKRGLSTKGDKEDLCYRILKKLGGDYTLYSSAASRRRSYSTKKRAPKSKKRSTSKTSKSSRKSKTSRKSKKSKTQKRKGYRARKSSSSIVIRVKPYRRKRLTKGQQRSSRYTHSITGSGKQLPLTCIKLNAESILRYSYFETPFHLPIERCWKFSKSPFKGNSQRTPYARSKSPWTTCSWK